MKLTMITIGKPRSKEIVALAEKYSSRIAHYANFELLHLKDEKQALSKIKPQDFVVVLDERGKILASTEFANFIGRHQTQGTKHIVFFIGGENGVEDGLRRRANFVLSLSRLTFPHELALVILLEQVYRAFSIIKGEPYHRE